MKKGMVYLFMVGVVLSLFAGCGTEKKLEETEKSEVVKYERKEGTLLPIGSVVLLKDSTKRVMIIGVLQNQTTDDGECLWDYSGCLYPEGYMGPNETFLFNDDQIESISSVGYQDEEQAAFEEKVKGLREELRSGQK